MLIICAVLLISLCVHFQNELSIFELMHNFLETLNTYFEKVVSLSGPRPLSTPPPTPTPTLSGPGQGEDVNRVLVQCLCEKK